MKIDIRPRRAGKTTDLIKECAENGGYIVCCHKREAERIHKTATDMGLSIPLPMTWYEFMQGLYSSNVRILYIDNIDMCLQHAARVPIRTITASCDG
jgi:hypothetical protein